ncbi:MAG: terminase, partial [Rhodospirillaceae bacterium]|nr:terminase [Rhodospirillaceae bacterium]
MSPHDRDALNTLLRHNFVSFIQRTFQTVAPGQVFMPTWHIEAIAHHLMLCMQGRVRRLIITLPPRSLKSICASVAYPAFLLGHDSGARIVCVSYAEGLALRHARDCRTVMQSRWYQDAFSTRINPRKNTEAEFETTAQGRRLATTIGGTLTGLGGRLIIVDDSMKPSDAASETRRRAILEWYETNLVTRLDSKKHDVIIVIMQRLHVDDLVGYLLQKGEDWTHLDLPAIAEVPQDILIGENEFHHRAAGDVLHPAREPL